jgi:hypothetical protein
MKLFTDFEVIESLKQLNRDTYARLGLPSNAGAHEHERNNDYRSQLSRTGNHS